MQRTPTPRLDIPSSPRTPPCPIPLKPCLLRLNPVSLPRIHLDSRLRFRVPDPRLQMHLSSGGFCTVQPRYRFIYCNREGISESLHPHARDISFSFPLIPWKSRRLDDVLWLSHSDLCTGLVPRHLSRSLSGGRSLGIRTDNR